MTYTSSAYILQESSPFPDLADLFKEQEDGTDAEASPERDSEAGVFEADSNYSGGNPEAGDKADNSDYAGSTTQPNTPRALTPPFSSPTPKTEGQISDLLDRVSITPQQPSR